MKKFFILIVLLILLILGAVALFQTESEPEEFNVNDNAMEQDGNMAMEDDTSMMEETREPIETIGQSVNGNDIMAYHFGDGDTEVLFVGGIHAGYGPSTSLVTFELIDALEDGDISVPEDMTVTVIPVLNPDGLDEIVGTTGAFTSSDIPSGDRTAGRFNGGIVDLNRNFDCDWQSSGVWRSQNVSGGEEPFSEPEAQALRAYVENENPDAVVVYYSQAGEVVSGNCSGSISSEIEALTNTYADAAGYEAKDSFEYYEVNGDATNWMAKIGVPAIGVLLGSHTDSEWSQNSLGIEAALELYAQ